jgi:hypothetical protein
MLCLAKKLKYVPRILLLTLVFSIVFSACSLSQEFREVSVIDSDKILVHRFPHAVVVSFSDQFDTKIATLYPDDDSSSINLGKMLKASLLEAVKLAYDDVYLATDPRVKNDVSRVLRLTIVESQIVLADALLRSDKEDQSLSPLRLAVFAAAVSIETYGDDDFDSRKDTVVRASSRFFRKFERKKDVAEFRKAVDMVIQRIAYDTANLLLQGFVEPE